MDLSSGIQSKSESETGEMLKLKTQKRDPQFFSPLLFPFPASNFCTLLFMGHWRQDLEPAGPVL